MPFTATCIDQLSNTNHTENMLDVQLGTNHTIKGLRFMDFPEYGVTV
jgi:hypothetical protein